MKAHSKQQPHSKQKIQTTSGSSDQRSSVRQAASTLRTASTRILSVLDWRVQRAAEKAVVESRPTVVKKKLNFLIPKGKVKINPTVDLDDAQMEALDRAINQLEGEAKADATRKRKAADQS